MRKNILLSGMIIPAMLYMQNISAQTAKELQTNIASQKNLSGDINTYQELWEKFAAPRYRIVPIESIYEEILKSNFIDKEIALYMLQNQPYNNLPSIGQDNALPYCLTDMLLEQDRFLDPDRRLGQKVFSPVIDKKKVPVNNKSIEQIFPNVAQDSVKVCFIHSDQQSFMGTTFIKKIIINTWSINGINKIAHSFNVKGWKPDGILSAVITNEKIHYTENKVYGGKVSRNEVVAHISGHDRSRIQIAEFLSDAASLDEDPSFLFSMISSFIHAKATKDSAALQLENYALSYDLLEKFFTKYGISSTPHIGDDVVMTEGDKTHTETYIVNGASKVSADIYNNLTPEQIADIQRIFMQRAKQYVAYMDAYCTEKYK